MGRSSTDCVSHDQEVGRGHWRPCEDETLRRIVEQYGPKDWNFVSKNLPGRSGKSCRLRWFNQLDPRINRSPLTEEEEERLLAAHRIYGNRWSSISRFFPGRTDNCLKNQWHVINARRQRAQMRKSSKELQVGGSLLFIKPSSGFLKSSIARLSPSEDCSVYSNPERNRRQRYAPHVFDRIGKKARIATSRNEKMMGRNAEEERGDELVKIEIPFIDFLGVGFDGPRL